MDTALVVPVVGTADTAVPPPAPSVYGDSVVGVVGSVRLARVQAAHGIQCPLSCVCPRRRASLWGESTLVVTTARH